MNFSIVKQAIYILTIAGCSFSCTDRRPDNSLTVSAYRELGMPDPGKKWEMKDYTQARNVLAKLKWERPLQLPAKDSEKSGTLFDHMVSLEYLAFLQDSTLSRNEKAERISAFGVVYEYWLDIYNVPTVKPNYYNREIMDIRIFNLNVAEAAFSLANEIKSSNEPADVALQYGYGAIKRAYLECLHNYLQPRSNGLEFNDQDMERVLDRIYHSVMRNKVWLDRNEVIELKQSLRSVMDHTASTVVRNKYKQLEEELPS